MNSLSFLEKAWILSIPVLISGTLHMLVVKLNLFSFIAVPLSIRLFGKNKTWRGIIVFPLCTLFGVVLASFGWPQMFNPQTSFELGLSLGVAYVLAELPNSYFKRKLGIPPGKRPEKYAFLFTLLDQADSAIGCVLVYYWFLRIPFLILIFFILFGTAVHLMMNMTLYLLKLRKEPF